MPRAKRHFLPGYTWHITHRCHKKEFLLKFARDKSRWLHWLKQAKQRFGLPILDYVVTSSHIHLLAHDGGRRPGTIARSMHLVAGRTAQEYNLRKNRRGAFWEDRYHAVAIENGRHLFECLAYVDLNMVRAGVVVHPAAWKYGGYREIQGLGRRRFLIDFGELVRLCGVRDRDALRRAHNEWVERKLRETRLGAREEKWTESLAVGSKKFVDQVQTRLGIRAKWRKMETEGKDCVLRERGGRFMVVFRGLNQRKSG